MHIVSSYAHLTRNCGVCLSAFIHLVSCRFRLQFPFVFRRLQSLQLLLPAHPCFLAFAFWLLWALHSTDFTPLPVDFLTSAVFAFFRPLQFWIPTTQPLLFLSFSSRFRLAAASPVPASAFTSTVSSFSPAWFPMRSIPILVLGFAVRFLSPFPDSLPQPFLRCLLPAFAFRIFRFPSAFFRPLPFHFRLLSLLRFLFPSSRFPLAVVLPVPVYPLPFRLVSHASLSALVLSFLQFLSTVFGFASQRLPSVGIPPISLQDTSP